MTIRTTFETLNLKPNPTPPRLRIVSQSKDEKPVSHSNSIYNLSYLSTYEYSGYSTIGRFTKDFKYYYIVKILMHTTYPYTIRDNFSFMVVDTKKIDMLTIVDLTELFVLWELLTDSKP